MKNVFRAVISALFLGLGLYCLTTGNPAWLLSAGFTDGTLPAILVVLGIGLGAVAALCAWPFPAAEPVSQEVEKV